MIPRGLDHQADDPGRRRRLWRAEKQLANSIAGDS